MERLEQGSTPEVGSSRTTTLASPTKAMATDSFLCMPPRSTRGPESNGPQVRKRKAGGWRHKGPLESSSGLMLFPQVLFRLHSKSQWYLGLINVGKETFASQDLIISSLFCFSPNTYIEANKTQAATGQCSTWEVIRGRLLLGSQMLPSLRHLLLVTNNPTSQVPRESAICGPVSFQLRHLRDPELLHSSCGGGPCPPTWPPSPAGPPPGTSLSAGHRTGCAQPP